MRERERRRGKRKSKKRLRTYLVPAAKAKCVMATKIKTNRLNEREESEVVPHNNEMRS